MVKKSKTPPYQVYSELLTPPCKTNPSSRLFRKLKMRIFRYATTVSKMKRLIKKGIPGVDLKNFTPYQYFYKNRKRIDYQSLKSDKRPRGSGIIESGIRRIINLRFKNPSTFWYPDNVEKLILMRSIALSGRWEIMMKNITKARS